MSRHLRSQLERAERRLEYARRERERFEQTLDVDDARAQRTWHKLNADVEAAERDVGYAQHAMSDAAFAAFKAAAE